MLNQPIHTKMRRSLGNVFDRNSLAAMQSSIEATVERLLDGFSEELRKGPADFCALVCDELPVITIGEWMGLPPSDYGLLSSLTHDQVHTQELFPTPSQLALSDAATYQLRKYFTELIEERRKVPGDDPVSAWIRTWDALEPDRERVDDSVRSLALFMVIAALETTAHVLSGTVRLLLGHPRQLEWLRSHPEHVPNAIDEVLRYDAPIHMISRVATEATELDGVPVREGEMMQLMVGAAHHDPDQYTDPGIFDTRRKAAHLSFGGGGHYCLGNALARLEATALLTSMLRRPTNLSISSTPVWAPRVAFRRLTSLQLISA
ncbi:cytochrome P450 [Streptomyces celluloflavus]|uniref:cytochrome P450 n=1 Tax=Streptomyces celluloflavus TaxID=58344 RepID=UPI0036DB6137